MNWYDRPKMVRERKEIKKKKKKKEKKKGKVKKELLQLVGVK